MFTSPKHSPGSRPPRRPATAQRGATSTQGIPYKLLGGVIGALILIILITFGVQSCTSDPYDWNNLTQDQGRFSYSENGEVTSLVAIDVSSHQNSIDWSQVSQDNVDVAMLRCGRRGTTEGSLYADETFAANAQGAAAANIPFGVYFFSQAINEDEARQEAQFVLEQIQGMDVKGPIAYDFELLPNATSRADGLSTEQITKNAQAFCEVIEKAGYKTMVYGNQHDLERYNLHELGRDVWYAEYTDTHPDMNFTQMKIWQYTSTGTVAGVPTEVDLNVVFDRSLFGM